MLGLLCKIVFSLYTPDLTNRTESNYMRVLTLLLVQCNLLTVALFMLYFFGVLTKNYITLFLDLTSVISI